MTGSDDLSPASTLATSAQAAQRMPTRLEDVLGDVVRCFPVGFYPRPGDEEVERDALDAEIFAGLVSV